MMYRFSRLAILLMLSITITNGPLSDLDLRKIPAWKLVDGTLVVHYHDLTGTGVTCEKKLYAYPVGIHAECDHGRLIAATADFYLDYTSQSGAVEVLYSPITKRIMHSDGVSPND